MKVLLSLIRSGIGAVSFEAHEKIEEPLFQTQFLNADAKEQRKSQVRARSGWKGGLEMIRKGASKIQGDMKLVPKNLCVGKAL